MLRALDKLRRANMSEITYQQKELKGLGGWLVLFQIQVWNTLAGVVQIAIMIPLFAVISRKVFSFHINTETNPFEAFSTLNSPITYLFVAAIFALILLCIIFFYRKKIVFRVLFIISSVLYIIGMVLYYFFFLSGMYADMTESFANFNVIFTVYFILVGLLPVFGIHVALIIALYKSKRVKNTFN